MHALQGVAWSRLGGCGSCTLSHTESCGRCSLVAHLGVVEMPELDLRYEPRAVALELQGEKATVGQST